MIETLFLVVESVVSKVTLSLFSQYIKSGTSDFLAKRRIDTAQRRTADQLIIAFAPFLNSELPQHEAKMMVHALKEALERFSWIPEVLAKSRYDIDALIEVLANSRPQDATLPTLDLELLFRRLIRPGVVALVQIAPQLPNWELANWTEAFEGIRVIIRQNEESSVLLEQLRSEPERRERIFTEKYLEAVERECSRIPLLGIAGTLDLKRLSLVECFIPIRLRENSDERVETSAKPRAQDDYQNVQQALTKSRRILLLGGPGAGKSTIVRHDAMISAGKYLRSMSDGAGQNNTIPFLLRIREIRDFDVLPSPKNLMSYVAPALDTADAQTFVSETLMSGRGLLIIDGLDECQLPVNPEISLNIDMYPNSEWDRLMRWLADFVEIYSANQFIITTRPSGYIESRFKELGFITFNLATLEPAEQELFIKNWYRGFEIANASPEEPLSLDEAEKQGDDLFQKLSQNRAVLKLMDTPLMLSVLCTIHRSGNTHISERRSELLDQCVDVLLYKWRARQGLRKNVLGDLDNLHLRALLQPLALRMIVDGKVQASKDYVQAVFSENLPTIQQPASRAPELVATIRDRTGVLLEVQPGEFAFSHLIIRDYLAAEEFGTAGTGALLKHASDPTWAEVFVLAAGGNSINSEELINVLLEMNHLKLAIRCLVASVRITLHLRHRVMDTSIKTLSTMGWSGGRSGGGDAVDFALFAAQEMNGGEAAQILAHLPLFDSIVGFEEIRPLMSVSAVKSPLSLMEFAQTAVGKCCTSDVAQIESSYFDSKYFEISFESSTEELGYTWISGSLNFLQGNAEDAEDRVYKTAVLWDSINGLGSRAWSGIGLYLSKRLDNDEKKLTALTLFHQRLTLDDLPSFIQEIESLNVTVCPCTQIGLVNAILVKQEADLDPLLKDSLERRWQDLSSAVRDHYALCLREWTSEHWFEDNPLDDETRSAEFVNLFNELLLSQNHFGPTAERLIQI